MYSERLLDIVRDMYVDSETIFKKQKKDWDEYLSVFYVLFLKVSDVMYSKGVRSIKTLNNHWKRR